MEIVRGLWKLTNWTKKAATMVGMRERNVDRWGCLLWLPLLAAAYAFVENTYEMSHWDQSHIGLFDYALGGVMGGILVGAVVAIELYVLRVIIEVVLRVFEKFRR